MVKWVKGNLGKLENYLLGFCGFVINWTCGDTKHTNSNSKKCM